MQGEPRVLRDERAAAATAAGLHEAGVAEDGECLPQRHRRHGQAAGQLTFARQALAGLEHAGADRLADPAYDRLHGAFHLERREHGMSGGDVHPLETSTD